MQDPHLSALISVLDKRCQAPRKGSGKKKTARSQTPVLAAAAEVKDVTTSPIAVEIQRMIESTQALVVVLVHASDPTSSVAERQLLMHAARWSSSFSPPECAPSP
eukprot:Polyplicarium_translucidae@DN2776_c0_g1_i3.p2